MVLKGEKVILRPVAMKDASRFVRWFRDPAVSKFIQFRNLSLAEVRSMIRERLRQTTSFRSFVIETGKHIPIGRVELELFPSDRFGIVSGLMIAPQMYRSKGYGRDALTTILRFAFSTLHLHRVQLVVYEYNKPAIALYRKLGFTFEGRVRERVYWNKQYFDAMHMGLLDREWKKVQKRIQA